MKDGKDDAIVSWARVMKQETEPKREFSPSQPSTDSLVVPSISDKAFVGTPNNEDQQLTKNVCPVTNTVVGSSSHEGKPINGLAKSQLPPRRSDLLDQRMISS